MDGHGLIAFLESIRHDVPGPLQGMFDDVVQLVRNVVDALDQTVAPPDVMYSGKQQLLTHHSTLLDHISTLKTNLDDFQTVYTGSGSDAYFQTAYQAHSQLGQLTDHLSFAIGAHDSMAIELGIAGGAVIALGFVLGAFIVNTFLLPEGVPGYALEGAGAGFSLSSLSAAMASVGTTLTGLATAALPTVVAALPYVVAATAAFVVVTTITSDSSLDTTTLFATKLNTEKGPVRARKLSNGEVKRLSENGKSFEQIKAKEGYSAKADIYVDQDGNYWIVEPGANWAESFP